MSFIARFTVLMFSIFILLGAAEVQPAIAQVSSLGAPSDQGIRLEASLSKTLSAGHTDGRKFVDNRAMNVFYTQRDYHTYWLNDNGLTSKAHALITLLQDSWTHGLNPEKYHLGKIEQQLGRSFFRSDTKLELLLTDAAIKYARDLSGMRIDPSEINQKRKFWQQPEDAREILMKLSSSDNVTKTLDSFAPRDRLYQSLRKELIKLSSSPEKDFSHVLPLDFGKQYFFPGERSKAVPKLRLRLSLPQSSGLTYDDQLAQAVMAFQKKNNLEPDGIIGPKTVDILNQSNHKKILQIIANLERLRWLERELPEKYILVNTASQMLWAVENGRVRHEMKVINGKPWRRTKEFRTEIRGIRFNPDWTIPPGIKRYDIWPKIKEDPGYLHEKGIEVIRGRGENAVKLDPYSIDWKNISLRELHDLRFVGVPGEKNPLGYVRVLMPNAYNMYLHDTNHPELFEKTERTYSSGCIRMERPRDIAQFVLKGNREWRQNMIEEIIATGKKTEIDADVRMPIYVIHQTTWLDSRGKIIFGADIYKRDKDLIAVLEAIDGFDLPEIKEAAATQSPKILASNSLIP